MGGETALFLPPIRGLFGTLFGGAICTRCAVGPWAHAGSAAVCTSIPMALGGHMHTPFAVCLRAAKAHGPLAMTEP